jgi:pimeloyl-ACP methyl ester carboxylesterase
MRVDEHWLTADDGWRLNVVDVQPAEPTGVVVAGHSMMVDRRTLWRDDRPCLVRTLAESGLRVLVPDLRGHGASGPVAARDVDWSYDDLVDDVAVYLDLAGDLAPGRPRFLLGHSLFGHNSLAYLGLEPDAPVSGVVALAVNVWNRRWEPNRAIAGLQIAIAIGSMALVHALGFAPARALRTGSSDEARTYWREMCAWILGNTWDGRDGSDYHANLARVRCPVLHVLSDGDWLYGRPSQAMRFGERLDDFRETWVLGRGPSRDVRPDHMGMVTNPDCGSLWQRVAAWIRARC